MKHADKRRERYRLLRELGYAPKAARRLRDLSSIRIQSSINQQRDEFQSIPKAKRTVEDKRIIKNFRNVKTKNNSRILTKREKRDLWAGWSGKGGNFPSSARSRISELNSARGLNPFAGFGYQAYYFEWVEEFDDVDDGDFYEER